VAGNAHTQRARGDEERPAVMLVPDLGFALISIYMKN
jgi:hypothetical protein